MTHDWAAFQRRHGLTPDGRPGPRTLAAVEAIEAELISLRPHAPVVAAPYSFGGPPIRAGVDRDPANLLPGFAMRVEQVFRGVRRDGFDPLLWEGFRTHERAAQLAKRGTGIRMSMHCLGAAVDIVDGDDTHWDAPKAFWLSIQRHAEGCGLHVLYRRNKAGKRVRFDMPHVQAIPVREQAAFRKMSVAEREARVA